MQEKENNEIFERLKGGFEGVKNTLMEIWDKIKELFTNISNSIAEFLKMPYGKLVVRYGYDYQKAYNVYCYNKKLERRNMCKCRRRKR